MTIDRALIAAGLLACGSAIGDDSTAITIYSTAEPGSVPAQLYRSASPYLSHNGQVWMPGFAIVRHDRSLELAEGRSEQRFTGVASLLDPTTVRFESLTNPDGATVLEQDYQFDLVSDGALLQRYLEQEIGVWATMGDGVELVRGKLLSGMAGRLVLETATGLRTITSYSSIEYPALPEGLLTRPTLIWDLQCEEGGAHETRVSYLTEGATWWADYNVVYTPGANANEGVLDIGAWVSIVNRTGATYENARLKLVAGDVQRLEPDQQGWGRVRRGAGVETASAAGFDEKSFFEYHLYTLGRPTTLVNNATKQIELFSPATGVKASKVLVYAGALGQWRGSGRAITDRGIGQQPGAKVDVYLVFRNDEAAGLGVPLPKGRIRVSQLDEADGSLEFIGEDAIDHTARNELVEIRVGSAFDVVGERVQTDFKIDNQRQWMEESLEITIRNQKDEAVDVVIREDLFRWNNWEIKAASHEYEKLDADTIHLPVRVEAEGEVVVRYTVRYSW